MSAKEEEEFTEKDVLKLMDIQEKVGEALTALHGARMGLVSVDPLFAKTELYKFLSQAIDSISNFFTILKKEK